MPDPQPSPDAPRIRRVARDVLAAGIGLMALKFGVFWLTNSVAVLTDALESIINVVAAGFMLYSLWLSQRPADPGHPYGHGKAEFLAVGFEGAMIFMAALVIGVEAVRRLVADTQPQRLTEGIAALAGVAALQGGLAAWLGRAGRRLNNDVLRADARHLATDVFSTAAVVAGLGLVHWTGLPWLDPLVAMIVAALILWASWRLLGASIDGLMDRSDPEDDATIRQVLDTAVEQEEIRGYHKVRHRHQGPFHWVDMHLQVAPDLNVAESHEPASRIERRIETALGEANATAHVEPDEGARHAPLEARDPEG